MWNRSRILLHLPFWEDWHMELFKPYWLYFPGFFQPLPTLLPCLTVCPFMLPPLGMWCSFHWHAQHPLLALLFSLRPFPASPSRTNHPLLWATAGLHYTSWHFFIIIATLPCNRLFIFLSPSIRLKSLRAGFWVLITFTSPGPGTWQYLKINKSLNKCKHLKTEGYWKTFIRAVDDLSLISAYYYLVYSKKKVTILLEKICRNLNTF